MMDVTTHVHVKMVPLDIMNAYHRKLLNKYIKFLLKHIDFFPKLTYIHCTFSSLQQGYLNSFVTCSFVCYGKLIFEHLINITLNWFI